MFESMKLVISEKWPKDSPFIKKKLTMISQSFPIGEEKNTELNITVFVAP